MSSAIASSSSAATYDTPVYRSRRRQGRRHQRPRLFQVRLGDYVLMQTLGEGEYGKVKLGIHSSTRQEVAVKLIRKDTVGVSETRRSRVEREIHALRTLKHPNIVKLIDVVETDKYIGIILEYASGGELFEYILAHRMMDEDDARCLFAQLISSVNYMHHKKIVHRDLKLENLLLDANRNLLVTDFGFANEFVRDNPLMATSCGSPCYAAPELVVTDGGYAGPLADIWSCGVILYAMLCGHLPFDDDPNNPDGNNIHRLYRYILTTPLTFPNHVTPGARDLLRQMLTIDPSKRCSLDAIIHHTWLIPHDNILNLSDAALETQAFKTLQKIKPPLVQQQSPRKHKMDVDHLDANHKAFTVSAGTTRRRERILSFFTSTATKDVNMQQPSSQQEPSSSQQEPSSSQRKQPQTRSTRGRAASLSSSLVPATLRAKLTANVNRKTSPPVERIQFNNTDDQHDDEAIALQQNVFNSNKGHSRPRFYSTVGRHAARKLAVAAATTSPPSRHDEYTPSIQQQQQQDQTTATTSPGSRSKVIAWIKRKRPSGGGGTLSAADHQHQQQSATVAAAASTNDTPEYEERSAMELPSIKAAAAAEAATANQKQPAIAELEEYNLRVHYGAVDKAALTSCSPTKVMFQVRQILHALGIECDSCGPPGDFKVKCTRRAKRVIYAAPTSITLFPNPGRLSATSSVIDDIDNTSSSSLYTLSSSASTSANASDNDIHGNQHSGHQRVPQQKNHPIYGDPAVDAGEEIRFMVEVCQLPNNDHHRIIHVRRLRGNVWAFKFIYHKFMDLLEVMGTTTSSSARSNESLSSLAT